MDSNRKKSLYKTLEKLRQLPRKHADFFDWHNKETKEKYLCGKLMHHLLDEGGEKFESLRIGENPPDCVVEIGGEIVGIEVVEFVDQKAIEEQIRKKSLWSHQPPWTEDMVMSKLNSLIQDKNNPREKANLKEKYKRYIVLLHTDEPELDAQEFDRLFNRELLEATDLVTEAHIIFSYDPSLKRYPVIKLF
ncbi:MAG: hypothetical protein OEY96_09365 [Gammaproteobacteria bacterium]|nr:hypothetical protein [Gammaproteobacteria bacterium]